MRKDKDPIRPLPKIGKSVDPEKKKDQSLVGGVIVFLLGLIGSFGLMALLFNNSTPPSN